MPYRLPFFVPRTLSTQIVDLVAPRCRVLDERVRFVQRCRHGGCIFTSSLLFQRFLRIYVQREFNVSFQTLRLVRLHELFPRYQLTALSVYVAGFHSDAHDIVVDRDVVQSWVPLASSRDDVCHGLERSGRMQLHRLMHSFVLFRSLARGLVLSFHSHRRPSRLSLARSRRGDAVALVDGFFLTF